MIALKLSLLFGQKKSVKASPPSSQRYRSGAFPVMSATKGVHPSSVITVLQTESIREQKVGNT